MAAVKAVPVTITVQVAFGGGAAYVGLGGDVDMASAASLAKATAELSRLAPDTVFIDMDAVSFADATLVNFVVELVRELPPASSLVLCRPTGTLRYLLNLTRMDTVATVRDDLPSGWVLP